MIWFEAAIAGIVLGLGLFELYSLRRLRLQRERAERAAEQQPGQRPGHISPSATTADDGS